MIFQWYDISMVWYFNDIYAINISMIWYSSWYDTIFQWYDGQGLSCLSSIDVQSWLFLDSRKGLAKLLTDEEKQKIKQEFDTMDADKE